MRRHLLATAVVVLVAVGWWNLCVPRLVIYVDPALRGRIDERSLIERFREVGVSRVSLRPFQGDITLERGGKRVAVALVSRPGRNPLLKPADLERGLTGLGYTEDGIAGVYPEDVERFLVKHRRKYITAGLQGDWSVVRRSIETNTAVHEVWHAVAESHSHNPVDRSSVMYWNAAENALELGSQPLPFTQGHKDRLEKMFRPRWPWEDAF